jgi:hypothetical protein
MKMDTLLKAEELAGFRRVSWRKIPFNSLTMVLGEQTAQAGENAC